MSEQDPSSEELDPAAEASRAATKTVVSAAEPHEKLEEEPGIPVPVGVSESADGPGEERDHSQQDLIEQAWESVQGALRQRIQPELFTTWFERSRLVEVTDSSVTLAVQHSFQGEWIEKYYLGALRASVHAVLGTRSVQLVVAPELTVTEPADPREAPDEVPDLLQPEARLGRGSVDPAIALAPGRPLQPRGLLWNSDVVLNEKYTFENFVVGPCNRFGHAAAMGAGESPGRNYNPFFLHGYVGVGKTHLLQAVCFTVLGRWPETRILYLSCETFVNHFISALENGDLTEFRNKYRNVDMLVVDDIHLLANKERTQEEFFHTFNTLYNAGKQIVLSSDSPPKDIPTLQDRLVSRFKWGMVTEIEPPCYETRMAIVKRKSRDRGFEVPDDVAQLIAENIDRNVRELEGAVTRLIGYSSLTGKQVSLELAREALGDLLNTRTRRGAPSMGEIVEEVTAHFGVKLSELQSKKRTKSIAYPRQVAMFLARRITRHSLEEIGGFFGGRDHSTVLYAVGRIEKMMESDEAAREMVGELLNRLGEKAEGVL